MIFFHGLDQCRMEEIAMLFVIIVGGELADNLNKILNEKWLYHNYHLYLLLLQHLPLLRHLPLSSGLRVAFRASMPSAGQDSLEWSFTH
ncbi:hypothetical protein SFRURICE_000473 [Spodoptera frugiperda]|nr:hypothetical protein SFRURICE_000473 [Spodoptera frugiperda]